MSQIISWLFQQYQETPTHLLYLEIIAIIFGLLSVLFSKRDNLLVFPTGIISTLIFVYILWVYALLGDMLINAYYFIMSIVGWYIWTKKVGDNSFMPITKLSLKSDYIKAISLFVFALVFVSLVYTYFDRWGSWTAYIDTLTTAIFFVGMWLMAQKKIENWQFWIVGDLISIPLYLVKGLVFTAFQYFIFTIIAYYGYKAWKKQLNQPNTNLLK